MKPFHAPYSIVPESTGSLNLGKDDLRWLEAFLNNLNVSGRATVPTPVNGTDATTKDYVDARIGLLTIEEADGDPSLSTVTILRFDQADGLVLTEPSSGVARLDLAAIPNAVLANSSVTVTAGSRLSGGGTVALGAAVTLNLDVGTATTNRITKWSAAGVTNSLLSDDATNVSLVSGQLLLPAGTAGAPSLASSAAGGSDDGVYFPANNQVAFSVAGTVRGLWEAGVLRFAASTLLGWASSDPTSSGEDLILLRDAADILSQRRTTNAQESRIENTFTDANNREFASLGFINNANVFTIQTETVGGTVRNIALMGGRVSIGTAAITASALLDLASTTGALLVPRMTTVQRDALTAANGMVIYNTTTATAQAYVNGAWTTLGSGLGGILSYQSTTTIGVAGAYTGPSGDANSATLADVDLVRVPAAGTLRNLYVRARAAAGAGESFVYTVYVNGAGTAITVTVSNPNTEGADTVNTVSLSAGDRVAVLIDPSAGAAVTSHGWSLQVV